MTTDDEENGTFERAEAWNQQLTEQIRPALKEAYRLVTEEGIAPDELRFEIRPRR